MYPGGKSGSGVYQTIINQMPPHRVYIEAFLGGGAIMRLKKPAISSIGIDADAAVISGWSQKIQGLTLINADAISWLSAGTTRFVDAPDTLIYIDPPYLMDTRSSRRPIYRHEMDYQQHVDLLDAVKKMHCMVMISGYFSELYQEILFGWRYITYQAQTRSGRTATEYLWMNFPEPVELHDYRYLGENFRERERIKRKKTRWTKRLESMDSLERYAILSAIETLRTTNTVSGDEVPA